MAYNLIKVEGGPLSRKVVTVANSLISKNYNWWFGRYKQKDTKTTLWVKGVHHKLQTHVKANGLFRISEQDYIGILQEVRQAYESVVHPYNSISIEMILRDHAQFCEAVHPTLFSNMPSELALFGTYYNYLDSFLNRGSNTKALNRTDAIETERDLFGSWHNYWKYFAAHDSQSVSLDQTMSPGKFQEYHQTCGDPDKFANFAASLHRYAPHAKFVDSEILPQKLDFLVQNMVSNHPTFVDSLSPDFNNIVESQIRYTLEKHHCDPKGKQLYEVPLNLSDSRFMSEAASAISAGKINSDIFFWYWVFHRGNYEPGKEIIKVKFSESKARK